MGKLKFGASERAREAYAGLAMWADSPGGKKYPRQTRLNARGWVFTWTCIWIYVHQEAGMCRALCACGGVCIFFHIYGYIYACVYVKKYVDKYIDMCGKIEINMSKNM